MRSKILLTLVSAGLLLTGCAKEPKGNEGRLRIVFEADPAVQEATRSLDLTAPGPENFTLQVAKNDGTYDRTWDNLTEYPGEGYTIETGAYTATVFCGNTGEEDFDSPCFGATKEFSIYNQVTTRLEITACLTNMAVSVGYTDEFKNFFPEHSTVITTSLGKEIDFSENPDGIAYISPEAFDVKVSYTYQPGGALVSGSESFKVENNVGPRRHMKVLLDVKQDVGKVSMTIWFNDDMEVVEWDVECGDEE